MTKEIKQASPVKQRLQEGGLILAFAVAVFFMMSLLSYHHRDPGWSTTATHTTTVANLGGRFGAWFSDFTLYLFGYCAYLFPLILAYGAWRLFLLRKDMTDELPTYLYVLRGTGFLLTMLAGSGFASLLIQGSSRHLPFSAGGILGNVVSQQLDQAFNEVGAILLLLAFFLIGITLCTGLSWIAAFYHSLRFLKLMTMFCVSWGYKLAKKMVSLPRRIKVFFRDKMNAVNAKRQSVEKIKSISMSSKQAIKKTEPKIIPVMPASQPIPQPKETTTKRVVKPIVNKTGDIHLPDLDLLDPPESDSGQGYSRQQLEEMSCHVEEKLLDFGVKAQVVAVHPGPVITRFELQPAPGVKASKISGLSRDLARSLSVMSVRVVEVIPGKSVVGLEVPNQHRDVVRLSEILNDKRYHDAKSFLTLGLGHDISGHAIVVDLQKMPHLLVAGTTGSGKSVGLNAMLLSLLYKATPDDVRMILVDPKMLELAIYDGIPHLLAPVVTDMKEAANALRWCVAEMERRYCLMASLGVRNLAGFNAKVKQAKLQGKPLMDPLFKSADPDEAAPELEKLPYIVVLIDEFADMMMVVGKKVEQLIARIAQKARAAGIHLILATQRPSVDVITGLIKANVPTRIAFQVSSRVDSRTILDQQGAENLLGYGDMLYMAPGSGVPMRVHGAFVDDQEVHNVVDAWKSQKSPDYIEEVLGGEGINSDAIPMLTGLDDDNGSDSESDPLYDQAVQIVIETRRASISSIQRRLKIGYNRAARLIETMEMAGLVSPMESNGNREVLVPAPNK